jgi:hypothetical protein
MREGRPVEGSTLRPGRLRWNCRNGRTMTGVKYSPSNRADGIKYPLQPLTGLEPAPEPGNNGSFDVAAALIQQGRVVGRSSTALHCTALHCTALHCTALHCRVVGRSSIWEFNIYLVDPAASSSPRRRFLPI